MATITSSFQCLIIWTPHVGEMFLTVLGQHTYVRAHDGVLGDGALCFQAIGVNDLWASCIGKVTQ